MTKPTREYATRSQIKRAIDAARDAGIEIGGVEVAPDGTIRILSLAQTQPERTSAYDQWKAREEERVLENIKRRLGSQAE